MRVTVDEAARQKEAFEEFMDGLVGEDITVSRGADFFRVEILRKRVRTTHPKTGERAGWIDVTPFVNRKDI